MSKEQIFSESMYEGLHIIKELAQFSNHNYEHSGKSSDQETLSFSLIQTGNQKLIDKLINNNVCEKYFLKEIAESYVILGMYDKLFELLRIAKFESYEFDYEGILTLLFDKKDLGSIAKYIGLINGFDDKQILQYIDINLGNLWDKKDNTFTQQIANLNLLGYKQEIIDCINDIYNNKIPSINETIEIIKRLKVNKDFSNNIKGSLDENKHGLISSLFKALYLQNLPLEFYQEIILFIYESKISIRSIRNLTNEIIDKIQDNLISQRQFEQLENFMNIINKDSIIKNDYLEKVIEFAIVQNDKELHLKYITKQNITFERQINKILKSLHKKQPQITNNTSENPNDLENDLNFISKLDRNNRIRYYKLKALKFGNLAVFEILHGDEEKSKDYIKQMIENTENITKSTPQNCSKRDKGHIRGRVKIPFKRQLKDYFKKHNLFHHLPKDYGWNTDIIDTKLRDKNKAIRHQLKVKQREENIIVNNKKYSYEELIEDKKKTEYLNKLMNENKFEDAIQFLEKESDHNRSNNAGIWERGMLVLDKIPESMRDIFSAIKGRSFKGRDYTDPDYNNYELIASFLIKGHQLGMLSKYDWIDIAHQYNNIRSSNDGHTTLNVKYIIPLIKQLLEANDFNTARDFYLELKKFDKYSIPALNTTGKATIISIFIKYTFIQESRNIIQNSLKEFECKTSPSSDEIDSIIQIDTISDINSLIKNNVEYEENINQLLDVINNSKNPKVLIRTLCRKFITLSTKSNSDIINIINKVKTSDSINNEKIKRRIIYTLIEKNILGEDIINDIKSIKSTKFKRFFLKKLINVKYLSDKTSYFLRKNSKPAINGIFRLLTEYNKNEFNNIIGILDNNDDEIRSTIRFNYDNRNNTEYKKAIKEMKKKLFKPTDWNKVFKILKLKSEYEIDLKLALKYKNEILNHKNGIQYGYFMIATKNSIKLPNDFPISINNFLDKANLNDKLFSFDKDPCFQGNITIPWTKKWFLENPNRLQFLKPENMITFQKFGTIIGLGIIEGSENKNKLSNFYEYIFKNISHDSSRSSILQLGEVFNLILKKNNYNIFNELVNNEINIGNLFESFITQHNISDKGRTIITLLITREINHNFQIYNDINGVQQVENSTIKNMLISVFNKLKKYINIIDLYKNMPIKTSIGLEYEVTKNIALGYEQITGTNYKNDITILSEYSGISRGGDAVHEIATKPTDNPYLLLLELKLLEDLDFLDLNFKKEDYKKGARGIHLSAGGEIGIELDEITHFIQNILLASNIGGINAGKYIKQLNNLGTIKERGWDCEILFGEKKTACVEYRSFSIDKAESFERLIISAFNLNLGKQSIVKTLNGKTLSAIEIIKNPRLIDSLINSISQNINKESEIACAFLNLIKNTIYLIKLHNTDFLNNESFNIDQYAGLDKLLSILTSQGPIVEIMKKCEITTKYLIGLFEHNIIDKSDFKNQLIIDNKKIDITQRQFDILYLEYTKRFVPALGILKMNNINIYNNIQNYLNGNIQDTIRKITNYKRFTEVIGEDKTYINETNINPIHFFMNSNSELINKFIRINNLFIKKDSINALGMLNTTKELNGEIISDARLTDTTIFDKIDQNLPIRKGYNIIQGASETMLTQAIQKFILEFNEQVFGIINS